MTNGASSNSLILSPTGVMLYTLHKILKHDTATRCKVQQDPNTAAVSIINSDNIWNNFYQARSYVFITWVSSSSSSNFNGGGGGGDNNSSNGDSCSSSSTKTIGNNLAVSISLYFFLSISQRSILCNRRENTYPKNIFTVLT